MIYYMTMGWAAVFTIRPLIETLTRCQLWLLVGGGISYTIGAIWYGLGKKKKYMNSVFHIFIVLGSILQFFCIFFPLQEHNHLQYII